MKATVSAASLKSAASWVSKVVKTRATLPILEYLMLSASDGTLEVKATDLSMTLVRQVKADVSEPGQVLIKARELKDYLKGAKNATLTLEGTAKVITARTDKASMTFYGLDPNDYPLVPQDAKWDNAISIDPAESMLPEIAKFADNDKKSTRLVLTCILVEVSDGNYRLTTADGFRLVTTNAIPNAIPADAIASYLLPASVVKPIAALKAKGVLKFSQEKNIAEFTADTSRVQCMLVDGKFPDYNQIIPANDRGVWVVFDTMQLKQASETMANIGKYRAYLTMLNLSSGKAMLSTTSEDGNELETSMDVDWTGEELVIGFNAKYMLDCLALCGEQTRIMLENASRPLLIKGNGCLMVVMPMHIQKGRI